MHHELLNMYAVAWLFGGIGFVVSVAHLAARWKLGRAGKTIPVHWGAFYCGFAYTIAFAWFTCLIVAHHGPGWPHF
jgi:hypothetical protein